jgi:hypothetical protein
MGRNRKKLRLTTIIIIRSKNKKSKIENFFEGAPILIFSISEISTLYSPAMSLLITAADWRMPEL